MKPCVLITGASGGIGQATAEQFAREGWNVAVQCHNGVEQARELSARLEAMGARTAVIQCDISDYEQCVSMVETARVYLGDINALVNNAGIADIRTFSDITPDKWRGMLDVNLTGVYNCTHALVKAMVSGGMEGLRSIVNVTSVWGVYGASCESHYSAAKSGVIGLTKALAKELGVSGVRVNAVAPGVIDTRMNEWLDEEEMGEIIERTPLMRVGRPEEVAQAIYFLAGEGASFITGAVLEVTGGFY